MSDELRKALEELEALKRACEFHGLSLMVAGIESDIIVPIRQALAASSPPSRSAPDHVLVPREPTTDMIYAGEQAINAHIMGEPNGVDEADACYLAMLAAAPPVLSSAGDAWGAGDEDADGNPLLTVRADEHETLKDALQAAILRLETIRETHPDIALDQDLEAYRAALSASSSTLIPDGELGSVERHLEALRDVASELLEDTSGVMDELAHRVQTAVHALAVLCPATRDQAFKEAANVAEAIDSGRGNEAEIAKAIRALKGASEDKK